MALAFILVTSGCTMKKSSQADETSDHEAQGDVKYKSLIDKYVGETGMPYRAYYEIVKWDSYYDTIDCMLPAGEWTDSDGKLGLPFEPRDIETFGTMDYQGVRHEIYSIDEMKGVVSYYIPDELAVKASTDELIDILWSYGCDSGWIMAIKSPPNAVLFEHEFNNNVAHCNALEESLRRDDFAGKYLERYIAESENMPEYYEGMEDEDFSLFLSYMSGVRKTHMLDLFEVILAQPEAYAQFPKEQRVLLVKRVLEKEKLGEQKKICFSGKEYRSLFFACITGECYLSGNFAYSQYNNGEVPWRTNPYIMGEIQWQNNPWLDAINEMELTEDERRIVDRYFTVDE